MAVNGKVMVGDGYSGTRLLALDGISGRDVWQFQANDNGIGSPALNDDGSMITFTSESCTLYTAETATGKLLWKRLLAGSLQTHPAIGGDSVYAVYPNTPNGDGTQAPGGSSYALGRFELSTGKVTWAVGLGEDVITAPVVCGDTVYLTTHGGTIKALNTGDGKERWTANLNATCAPVVRLNTVYFSSWRPDKELCFAESLLAMTQSSSGSVGTMIDRIAGPYPADYMIPVTINDALMKKVSDNPYLEEFEPMLAEEILKTSHPSSPALPNCWSAYGPRPTIAGDDGYVMLGDHLISANVRTGRLRWTCKISGYAADAVNIGSGEPPLTPPAYAGGKIYMGSAWGDVLCIDGKSGKTLWRYRLANTAGVSSEVVLDRGRVYAVTNNGMLFSINTGDQIATGWSMPGGSASRNGNTGELSQDE